MARAGAVQSFYGRWARAYDLLATRLPGVDRLRARAVDALALAPGDTVVEVGCGTGANLAHLRRRVGSAGRVVGVDLTREVLDVARGRIRRRGWGNVQAVRGDATDLPVDGPVDGVLGSFVVGMLAEPDAAVEAWLDLLGPEGRVALLDAASSPRRYAAPANAVFGWLVRLGAPPGTRGRESALAVLDRRVDRAHGVLAGRPGSWRETRLLGFVRLTAAP
jgi:ubiquinone/menaquinone biosynthesis C-methylase UbiE